MKYTIVINQYAVVNSGLDLDLIDLAIFDFIKDFFHSSHCVKIQTAEGLYFWVSHKLVLDAMPLLNIKTNQGLARRIDNLVKAEVLKKHPDCERYNKTLYAFGCNYDLITFTDKGDNLSINCSTPNRKLGLPPTESLGLPPTESLGYNNNNIYNTISDNSNIASQKNFASKTTTENTLFPDEEKKEEESKGKVTLFRNSEIYKLVKADTDGNLIDYSAFEKKFSTSEFAPVDMIYYFHSVSDWSDQKNMKRTKNGWLATIRNFIRGDIERKKLHLKPEFQEGKPAFDTKGALDYLNGYE